MVVDVVVVEVVAVVLSVVVVYRMAHMLYI